MYIVMGGSVKVRAEWSNYVHRLYVVEPSVQYLQNLCDVQNKLMEKYLGKTFPKELHITLILDDIGPVSDVMKSEVLSWIAANGRHIELRVLILLQHLVKQCPSEIRSQAELVFFFATGNRKLITSVHEEFVGCCEIRIFRSIFGALTENYGVLTIDNRHNALRVEECCFSTRYDIARPIRPFGSDGMRMYADMHHVDIDASGNLAITNETVRNLIKEDTEDILTDVEISRLKTVLDTRRIYNDRLGQVIVKRAIHFS